LIVLPVTVVVDADPKHLNPREGITTVGTIRRIVPTAVHPKHLNPREGITTVKLIVLPVTVVVDADPKHLNPREGITTVKLIVLPVTVVVDADPKHLNPREGITTESGHRSATDSDPCYPKHLNPREGITTTSASVLPGWRLYAIQSTSIPARGLRRRCPAVAQGPQSLLDPKHLNPREGITTSFGMGRPSLVNLTTSKAPQSPRGDYDFGVFKCCTVHRLAPLSKAPQSPRGDYDALTRRMFAARNDAIPNTSIPARGLRR
jgi:hypothetical protein